MYTLHIQKENWMNRKWGTFLFSNWGSGAKFFFFDEFWKQILQAWVSFGRILISGKFGRTWSDSVGFGRIWSDSDKIYVVKCRCQVLGGVSIGNSVYLENSSDNILKLCLFVQLETLRACAKPQPRESRLPSRWTSSTSERFEQSCQREYVASQLLARHRPTIRSQWTDWWCHLETKSKFMWLCTVSIICSKLKDERSYMVLPKLGILVFQIHMLS